MNSDSSPSSGSPPHSASHRPADPGPRAAPAPAPAPARRHRRYKPLWPRAVYYRHILRNTLVGGAIVLGALMIGVLGYHFTAQLGWLDSLVNASMILGGMGPVDPIRSSLGKWFESFYALFSGVVFIGSVGVMLAPLARRFLHRFHLDIEEDD
jgi:hypothetical protein